MKLTRDFVITLSIVTLFTLWGCSDSSDVQRLKSAFYMMDHDSIDEAEMVITLYSDTKMSKECQAIYNLAKTRLLYLEDKEPENDSLINYSIDYFKKNDKDKRLLAESYFYKGALSHFRGNTNVAIVNLKEAEIIANKLDDVNLTHKIYEMLCSVILMTDADKLANEYVHKNLELSKNEKNYNWYLIAACHTAYYYHKIGRQDSAYYYFESMKPYLNVIKKVDEKSEVLRVVGGCLTGINSELAEEYLKESAKIKPNSSAYNSLSSLYLAKNDIEKAQEYALEAKEYAENVDDSLMVAYTLLYIKKQLGEYREACDLYDEIALLNKNVNLIDKEKNVVKVQAQYNILAKEREFQATMQKVVLIIIFVVVVIVVLLFSNHIKIMKMKENQLKDQLLLEVYNGKIKDLETSESASSQKMQNLREKVTQLQQKQGERLSEGKKLYEHIINGGTIISWTKQDYNNFFDYYSLIDMPFMAHMEKDYDNLSVRSMIYLVLCKLGKTEDEIKDIFGISSSSIRSIKSRTKSRCINPTSKEENAE